MKRLTALLTAVTMLIVSSFSAIVAAQTTNLIANPAVTSSTNGQPTNWSQSSWGSSTTTFSYLTASGHTDTTSLQVTSSNRTSGDAKWSPDPASVTAGASYTYSDWYISPVTTELDAQYTD